MRGIPEDINELESETELTADLCIVGAGPAGLSIAREFFGTNVDVLILETGTRSLSAEAEGLSEIENIGAARQLEQTLVRNRSIGGSANTWQGKCTTFSEIDFEPRSWVPHSGWPIAREALNEPLDRAAEVLALGPNVYDAEFWNLFGAPPPEPQLDSRVLAPWFWQFSKNRSFPFEPMRMGDSFMARKTPNVRVACNANVVHLDTDAEQRVLLSLQVRSSQGKHFVVRAKATVLACGGIENARLLLASNRVAASGVGNRYDLVGRYLMDHLRVPVATFGSDVGADFDRRFDFYNLSTPAGRRAYFPGFVLSSELQRREQLLNCAAWIDQERSPDDPWNLMRRLARGKSSNLAADAVKLGTESSLVVEGLRRKFVDGRGLLHKFSRRVLLAMVEQVPNPDSRVTLGKKRDAFGLPVPQVDWRVAEVELATMARMGQLAAEEFGRVGLPVPELAEWARSGRFEEAPVIDIAHPTGTTRMSNDPRTGVVDVNCQVHGLAGLHIAGSSVFPTAGHANPTLMIVAMAIRLADHLKARVFAKSSVTRSAAATATENRKKVLVTGGTGFIGKRVLSELLARDYDVHVVTSRDQPRLERITWHVMDWTTDLNFEPIVEGCEAVLHLAAELSNREKMERVNVEATEALARTVEKLGTPFMAYASSVTVYGSPQEPTIDERTPLLETDSDYLAEPYMRAYARTKLAGERRIEDVANRSAFVIFRPAVVCDDAALVHMRNWSVPFRVRAAGRRTNHIYATDVAAAFVWAMERHRSNGKSARHVEVYNLSDEDPSCATYDALYRKAFRTTKDPRFLCPVHLPRSFDLLKDAVRYRASVVRPRYPLGMLRFSTAKLDAAGFRRPVGIARFYDEALRRLDGLA
jgi:choline dehydrogenase-like flavoprotein/nucleoside-diphosphate-sugar epimerase